MQQILFFSHLFTLCPCLSLSTSSISILVSYSYVQFIYFPLIVQETMMIHLSFFSVINTYRRAFICGPLYQLHITGRTQIQLNIKVYICSRHTNTFFARSQSWHTQKYKVSMRQICCFVLANVCKTGGCYAHIVSMILRMCWV